MNQETLKYNIPLTDVEELSSSFLGFRNLSVTQELHNESCLNGILYKVLGMLCELM